MLIIKLALLLGCAWLLAQVVKKVGLPAILGMIIGGVVVANGLFPLLPQNGSTGFGSFSTAARFAVLAVVLLRAGLGLPFADIRQTGFLAVGLGIIPMLCDAALVALGAVWLLDLSLQSAIVLGFLVAAISPAIVIPGLLSRIQRYSGMARRLTTALLTGAPLDNMAAIVLLGISVDLVTAKQGPLWLSLLQVPYAIGLSAFVGWLLGRWLAWVVGYLKSQWQLIGLVLVVSWLLIPVCRLAQIDFVICILVCGMSLRARMPAATVALLNQGLAKVWNVAQVFLFALIGAALDLEPLLSVGLMAAGVILLGQVGRALGTLVTTKAFGLGTSAGLACVLSYMPKATIQAAFAAMPLEAGLPQAQLHLSTAVLAIVLTVPIGIVVGHHFIDRLMQTYQTLGDES